MDRTMTDATQMKLKNLLDHCREEQKKCEGFPGRISLQDDIRVLQKWLDAPKESLAFPSWEEIENEVHASLIEQAAHEGPRPGPEGTPVENLGEETAEDES
jgi:hypothetical protein